jgi:hypothetical protein
MDALIQFFSSREWSFYPFIPPLFSLFANIYVNPIYSKQHEEILRNYLNSEGMGEKFDLINAIAKDRGLQVAYLSGIPAFIASIVATLKSTYSILLTIIVVITFLILLPLYLKVFLKQPGYHATTRFPEKAKPAFIFVREWTYHKFYSNVLILFNIFLIIIIIIALPSKQS